MKKSTKNYFLPMWNEQSLEKVLKENYRGYKVVIASHRQPYVHDYDAKGKLVTKSSVGGVSVTFDSIMKATRGVWVAAGDTQADRDVADKNGRVKIDSYTLRRVWLDEAERKGYYDGFSNQAIWPLCHVAFVRPKFSETDWKAYKKVNRLFADAILEEIKDQKAVVWIQDYQLALVAQYIKEKRPDVTVAQFWHIPWPTQEIFRICPWGQEIIQGLLHNDLLGFHRNYQATNFLRCVSAQVESIVNYEDMTVLFKKHTTRIGNFPISIDTADIKARAKRVNSQKVLKKYLSAKPEILAIGVDRVDYTKGIPNRLQAVEKLLENNPKLRGQFVYLGIGSPSRVNIPEYQSLNRIIDKLTDQINERFATKDWAPIHYIRQTVERNDIIALSKIADLALVTPLDDGMNLFAKEFVAANDGHGALILSYFTGVARSLPDSFQINPYDVANIAEKMNRAINTPIEEKRAKMKKMKAEVAERNVFRWASKYLIALAGLK